VQLFKDFFSQGRNLFISISVMTVMLILLVIAMYPGDEEAIKIFASLENTGIYKLFLEVTYGEGGEYRLWLAMELFSYALLIPVFMMVIVGTSIFSSEQDSNCLDILMSMPVSRRQIYIEKWFSMVTFAILFVIIGFLFTLIPTRVLDYLLPTDIIFVTWILMLPLLLFVGTISSFLGIYFLEQFKARLTIIALVAGMFLLMIVTRVNDTLQVLSYLSIFRYYNGAEILLKPSVLEINLVDPAILLGLTTIIFAFILWWIETRDLIPHYDQEKPEKINKVRGVPRLFFFTKKLKDKYPSLVEQIMADRMIINLFMVFSVFIGLSGPLAYVGDEEWALLVSSLGSNILYDAMLQGRAVPATLHGYMITQGYAALWLWFGIFAIIMGPRLVIRDNNGQTTDLLMGNPVKREKILLQRILAISIQWLVILIVISISSVLGQLLQNDTSAIVYSTVLFVVAVGLYWAWTMVGVLVAVLLNSKPRKSTSFFALLYVLVLLPYVFSGITLSLEPLAKLTPFYWYDPFAIFVEQTLSLETVGPLIIYIFLGIFAIVVAIRRYSKIDVVDTFEDKSVESVSLS
jgi:ABC-2 type transport system permease protein